jgi:hypothetical protein
MRARIIIVAALGLALSSVTAGGAPTPSLLPSQLSYVTDARGPLAIASLRAGAAPRYDDAFVPSVSQQAANEPEP